MKKILLIIFVIFNMITYSQNMKNYTTYNNKLYSINDTITVGFPNGVHNDYVYIRDINYGRLELYSNDKLIIKKIKRNNGVVFFEACDKNNYYIIQIELAIRSDEIIF